MFSIEEEVNKMVAKGVDEKLRELGANTQVYKNFIEGFQDTLESQVSNGRSIVKEFSEEKMKISHAEAEGYLRASIEILEEFKESIKYLE